MALQMPSQKLLYNYGRIDAELKLVIASNHDISLDRAYHLGEGGSADDVAASLALVSSSPKSVTRQNSITFLHPLRVASTPELGSLAFPCPSDEDRRSPASDTPAWAINCGTKKTRIPNHVDKVMTHGPA